MTIQKYIKSKKELGENLKKARIKSEISQDDVSKFEIVKITLQILFA